MAERAYVAVSGDMLDRLDDLLKLATRTAASDPFAWVEFHAAVRQWHDEVTQAAADA